MRAGYSFAIALFAALACTGCGDDDAGGDSKGDPFSNASAGSPATGASASGGSSSASGSSGSSTGSSAGSGTGVAGGSDAGMPGDEGAKPGDKDAKPDMMGMRPKPDMMGTGDGGMKDPMKPPMDPMNPMDPMVTTCPATMPAVDAACTGLQKCKFSELECSCREEKWTCKPIKMMPKPGDGDDMPAP